MLYIFIGTVVYTVLGVLWVKLRGWRFAEKFIKGVCTPLRRGHGSSAEIFQGVCWLPIAVLQLFGLVVFAVAFGMIFLVAVGFRAMAYVVPDGQ